MGASSSSGPPPPPPPRRRFGSIPGADEGDDWPQMRQYVLTSLREAKDTAKAMQTIQVSLAVLTTRVSLYAALVATVITGIIEIAITLLRKG